MNEIIQDIKVLGRDIKYAILAVFQRTFRGYADTDLWRLDYFLATKILPPLKAFRKQKLSSYPGNEIKTPKEWLKALDKMIYSFEFIIKDGEGDVKYPKDITKITEGLELFGKYFRALWD